MASATSIGSADRRRLRWAAAAAAALLLGGLAAAWQFTGLSELADPEAGGRWLQGVRDTSWAPLAVVAVFLAGGFVMFPVTVMITATAIAFGPWAGFAYASAGALASAMAGFALAKLLGPDFVRRLAGRKAAELGRRLADNGILAVASLRLLPVAPFTAINLMAGACGVRYRDFAIGTVLGMAPGLVVLSALGHRLEQLWRDPSWGNLAVLGLVLLAWAGLAFGLQRWSGARAAGSEQRRETA